MNIMSSSNKEITLKERAMFWMPLAIGAFFGIIIKRLFRPFYHALKIDTWLSSEPHYITDYSKTVGKTGYFKFEIDLTEGGEPELTVENVHLQAPIRITANREFDPGLLASLTEEDMGHDRRRLKTEIEAVLTNTPGIFNYQNRTGENCKFEEARSIELEYRIYPDGLSQHELITGIVSIANALRYVDHREEQLSEELREKF